MLNAIWVAMVVGAMVCGALTGKLDAVAQASTDAAGAAVELAIGLVGVMAFWLGMMRILQEGGLLRAIARVLGRPMRFLFPEVPADHPAMSMMVLNITSNMLGLGNAATPFGIKAMMALDELNTHKGTATNAMVLFLAINTSNLALLPTGMIAMRASMGSTSAGSILLPTILATAVSTLVAIITTKALVRLPVFAKLPTEAVATAVSADAAGAVDTSEAEAIINKEADGATPLAKAFGWVCAVALLGALGYALYQESLAVVDAQPVGWGGAMFTAVKQWPLVLLMAAILLFGVFRGVKIYDALVEGGKEGFQVALRIIPFLVAILVAVGMLRASGAIGLLVTMVDPLTSLVGMPAEALPMALLRPLSGSGAFGVAADIMKTHGPDSLIGQIVSTMQGSTETTFYVLAVYFGAVSVRNARHTVAACLTADLIGALAAVWACLWLLA